MSSAAAAAATSTPAPRPGVRDARRPPRVRLRSRSGLDGMIDCWADAPQVRWWLGLTARRWPRHSAPPVPSPRFPAIMGPMLDIHTVTVARSLTDAGLTPAQADAITNALRLAVERGDLDTGAVARSLTVGGSRRLRRTSSRTRSISLPSTGADHAHESLGPPNCGGWNSSPVKRRHGGLRCCPPIADLGRQERSGAGPGRA